LLGLCDLSENLLDSLDLLEEVDALSAWHESTPTSRLGSAD
jgi:hypothetical protein